MYLILEKMSRIHVMLRFTKIVTVKSHIVLAKIDPSCSEVVIMGNTFLTRF